MIWGYHGKPRVQPAVAVFIFLFTICLREVLAVHPCWCVLVSRCLRAEWAVSPAKWLSVVGLSRKIVATLQLLNRLSRWNQMGNCWSWVRVEPRDSHESVSLIWGLGGAGRRNKCGIAFGPSLTMLCTGGSCGQMISSWNWPPNAFQIFQGNQVGGFNKEHDRLAACTVFDVWWVVFNYVQCVFGFYGQFENICRKHM